MGPPRGESEPRPAATRSSRILGLVAAVGFSVALWVFIAMAVLGLILKLVGPKNAEEGLAAAGITLPGFSLENNPTEPNGTDANAGGATLSGTDGITTLDGKTLAPTEGKAAAPTKPPQPPAKAAPRE